MSGYMIGRMSGKLRARHGTKSSVRLCAISH
jgi:hypothetical protein